LSGSFDYPPAVLDLGCGTGRFSLSYKAQTIDRRGSFGKHVEDGPKTSRRRLARSVKFKQPEISPLATGVPAE
jgi:hypothetical protein